MGSTAARTSGYSPAHLFPDTWKTGRSRLDVTAPVHIGKSIPLDEGPAVSSPAFLLEALLGARADLFGVAPGVAWHAERLPFGARGSAVGGAVRGNSFEGDFS